ncbi:ABC transporter permease [Angustibacter sp. McL0619]|uniref:ABC transporter permease n=1 Tax=Angustibacter sp. McL0619 TaxID=3415676 RepID=UPI003CFBA108
MSTVTQPRPAQTRSALGPVVRPSFVRLTRIELRKSVDYRAGRWILGVIVGLAVLALAWMVWTSWHDPQGHINFRDFAGAALAAAAFLLPVLGILAMTSEWSQRTALTTFTLSPRRVPVLLAKLMAALLLMLAVMVSITVLAALATALAGAISGDPVSWAGADPWQYWGGQYLTQAMFVLMGAGFGALIPITGVALTAFFVAPFLFAILASTLLKHIGSWFDVFSAFDRIGQFKLDGKGWESLTSVLIWVVLPIAAGLFLSNRREVK